MAVVPRQHCVAEERILVVDLGGMLGSSNFGDHLFSIPEASFADLTSNLVMNPFSSHVLSVILDRVPQRPGVNIFHIFQQNGELEPNIGYSKCPIIASAILRWSCSLHPWTIQQITVKKDKGDKRHRLLASLLGFTLKTTLHQ
mmetsp:Transcript_12855/g.17855  ORF Transcript_12855/g.17855 Transcript_12855/m.17855 type:complete len:143 (+) Transcript_12855:139-567(+)